MMKTLLTFGVILGFASARSIDYLCKEGGPVYLEHPTDCEKFVQCHRDASGNLIGEIISCPFTTYWSTKFLTCLPSQNMSCYNDKCKGQPNGLLREGRNNCRGYWECSNGKSEVKCCKLGQRFDVNHGCVNTENEEDECKDNCLGVEYINSNETANETFVCNRRQAAGEPEFYIEEFAGQELKRPCSPGTVFVQESCNCGVAPEPAEEASCQREIYLPFTDDHNDMSGQNHFIRNENVFVHNGVADFDGLSSRISIPFFNNVEHMESIVIKINYTSTSGTGSYPQVLLSNSGCGFLPSIVISEDLSAVKFEVGTTRNLISSVSVPQPESMGVEKTVEYKFLNGTLIGSVNDVFSDITVNGYLRNVQCDLSIGGLPDNTNGKPKGMANFRGTINEISIYRCNPDSIQ